MAETISTMDIRARIGDLLNRVALRRDEFVIERKGRRLAALVPVERLEQMRSLARRDALAAMRRQAADAPGEAEADRLAAEAKKQARRAAAKAPRGRRARRARA